VSRAATSERSLAPDAIAEMTEQCRAQGTCEERECKGGERLERGCRRIAGRKEQLRKYEHGGRAVDVEIEELDRRADQARE